MLRQLARFGWLAILTVTLGCACTDYTVELQAGDDMNRRAGAVRVDFVWTTEEDAAELRGASSLDWFRGGDGKEAMSGLRKYESRIQTTQVGLRDIGAQNLVVSGGPMKPPATLPCNGFVIFARYADLDQLPSDALQDYYDADLKATRAGPAKACAFVVRLDSNRITLAPKGAGGGSESPKP